MVGFHTLTCVCALREASNPSDHSSRLALVHTIIRAYTSTCKNLSTTAVYSTMKAIICLLSVLLLAPLIRYVKGQPETDTRTTPTQPPMIRPDHTVAVPVACPVCQQEIEDM
jgi:hypothetical protein